MIKFQNKPKPSTDANTDVKGKDAGPQKPQVNAKATPIVTETVPPTAGAKEAGVAKGAAPTTGEAKSETTQT